jgi:hypothetical protein
MSQDAWIEFRAAYGLYRATRPIYNPVKRLVDFYASQVYPGILSSDGKPIGKGKPTAIPFSKDTKDNLKKAVAQTWQWSNFQAEEKGQEYVYRRDVDNLAFRYFKNGEPWDYDGRGAIVFHPYGFAPGEWFKHSDIGTMDGQPAHHGIIPKMNEINSTASQINDSIGKVLNSPLAFITDGQISPALGTAKRGKTGAAIDESGNTVTVPDITDIRQSVQWLKLKSGSDVKPLISPIDVANSMSAVDRMLAEVEADTPEITFWAKLREMSQVTGPAADRLMGDVKGKVLEAASHYDRGNKSLFGKAVAIAGYRLKEGKEGWANPTRQQLKFRTFNLDSYAKGDLDMEIEPRDLVPPTELEITTQRTGYYQSVKAGVDAGFPFEFVVKDDLSEDELNQLKQLKAGKVKQQQAILGSQNAQQPQDTTQSQNGQQPAQSQDGNQQPPQLQAANQAQGNGVSN